MSATSYVASVSNYLFFFANCFVLLQDYRLYPRMWKLGPPELWATRVLNPKKDRKNRSEVGPGIPIPDYGFSATEPLIKNPLDSWFNCFPGQLVSFCLLYYLVFTESSFYLCLAAHSLSSLYDRRHRMSLSWVGTVLLGMRRRATFGVLLRNS